VRNVLGKLLRTGQQCQRVSRSKRNFMRNIGISCAAYNEKYLVNLTKAFFFFNGEYLASYSRLEREVALKIRKGSLD